MGSLKTSFPQNTGYCGPPLATCFLAFDAEETSVPPPANSPVMAGVKVLACSGSYRGANATSAEDKQPHAAVECTRMTGDIDTKPGTPEGEEGHVTAEMRMAVHREGPPISLCFETHRSVIQKVQKV